MTRSETTPPAGIPADAEASSLALHFFGPFAVFCDGKPLPKMRSKKELWLLALLALRAHAAPIDRVWLAGALWPESEEGKALFYLRRSLMLLRDALGSEAYRISSPTPRTLRFDLDGADCDVIAFDQALLEGDMQSLQSAVALYRGPLLQDCAEDWLLPERETRATGVLTALEQLIAWARAGSNATAAVGYARRLLELDPLRETALRTLMEMLTAEGSHAAAGEAYRSFRLRLRRELNAEPDPETARLNRRLRAEGRQRADERVNETASRESDITGTSPSNLPTVPSPLIGRSAEREAVISLLETARLVTLTGTGGVGKTRLSLAVAEAMGADFVDGVCFVDLSPLSEANLLTAALLSALDIRESEGRTQEAALEAFLRSRRILLILDNCEHLLAGCARLTHALLRSCPRLQILATSREPLRVAGEFVWAVPGLAPEEALQLFAQRASQANFTFQRTPVGTQAIGRICERLDGIPLAIEIAAARTRSLSAVQIAGKLDGAFRLLNLPGGNAEPRHQTLRATMDWSYALLSEPERKLLPRLSVFAGGWTLDAAQRVCSDGDLDSDAALELLVTLVDKSLVVYSEDTEASGRYRFLETTRDYAAEMLDDDERERHVHRHADYFFDQVQSLTTSGEVAWNEANPLILKELPNLRAALNGCFVAGRVQRGLQFANALQWFWRVNGMLTEARQYLSAALAIPCDREAFLEERITALTGIATICFSQLDAASACRYYDEALPLAHAFGKTDRTARILFGLGNVYDLLHDREGARRYVRQAMAMWHDPEGPPGGGTARCLFVLGGFDLLDGDFDNAETLLEQSLRSFEKANDLYCAVSCYVTLGVLVRERIRKDSFEEALYLRGRALLRHGMELAHSLDDKLSTAQSLEALASLLSLKGDFVKMAALYGFSEALRETIDTSPMDELETSAFTDATAKGRKALGDASYAAAWAQGRALSVEQAIQEALTDGES